MALELPTTDDRPVWDLWLAAFWLPAVTAAIDTDVFESLAQSPASHPVLARRLALSERGMEILLPLLTALRLLVCHEGRYQLTDVARLYLLRGSPYFWGGLLTRMGTATPQYNAMKEALKHGEPTSTTGRRNDRPADAWEAGKVEIEQARMIAAFMHSHSVPAALGMARNIDFEGVRRLLDVGGGSGCFCIALAERHPELSCTIMELPAMCEVAGEYIAAARVGERVDTRAVDMFRQEWPRGYDAMFFSNILHDWDFDTCAQLLAKAHAALPDGGRVFIHEALLDDSGTGPVTVTTFSLVMLLGTQGRQFTFAELKQLLTNAGFDHIDVTPSYGYYSVVQGVRK
jgi:O-methyltransferase domain/Dimerisation domain